jgi:TonB family protein
MRESSEISTSDRNSLRCNMKASVLLCLLLSALLGSKAVAQVRKPPTPATKEAVPDVRATSASTRALTDVETSALVDTLKWTPANASLRMGGSAVTTLVDGNARALARVSVTWLAVRPIPGAATVASFRIKLENLAQCSLHPSAQLRQPSDLGPSIDEHTWFSWVNLKDTRPGASLEFDVEAPWGRNGTELLLEPLKPRTTLALCRTVGTASGATTREEGPAPSGGLVPVRVGNGVAPPKKIRDVPPVYPEEARQARVQGIVIAEATIGRDGHVTDARVLRSIPELDRAALDAVKQWQYMPTLLNGMPVPVIITVTVQFALH